MTRYVHGMVMHYQKLCVLGWKHLNSRDACMSVHYIALTYMHIQFAAYVYTLLLINLLAKCMLMFRVKINKNCQGPFGPLMSYFLGPSQSFKGPEFLISLMGLMTVSLSPQNFEGPQAILGAIGPPYFNPCSCYCQLEIVQIK